MIKMVRRKRIDPKKLSGRNEITCHIDIESIRSEGALITLERGEEVELLAETSLPTRDYFEDPENSRSVTGQSLPTSDLENLVSDILSNLLEKTEITSEKIDFLSACSDFFTSLKTPSETPEETRRILDLGKRKLEGKPSKIEFPAPKISANETKSKLVAVGGQRSIESKLKPDHLIQAFLDVSTFLSGISLGEKNLNRVSGMAVGLGSEILDAAARGHSDTKTSNGTVRSIPSGSGKIYESEAHELASEIAELIDIQRISTGKRREGVIPVNVRKSYKQQVKLIGCDVGENGSDLEKVTEIGRRASSYGSPTLKKVIDITFARLVGRLIKTMYEEELISERSGVCISGREYFGKEELRLVQDHLSKIGFEKIGNNLVLVKNPVSFGVPKNEFL